MSTPSSSLLTGCQLNHTSFVGNFIKERSVSTQVILYPMAMGCHVIDLGFKSLLFAIYAIGTIGGILAVILTAGCSKNVREFTKNSIILLADVSVVIGIDILGCVLGPVAYKIEDYARTYIIDKMIPGSKRKIEYGESCNWLADNQRRNRHTN